MKWWLMAALAIAMLILVAPPGYSKKICGDAGICGDNCIDLDEECDCGSGTCTYSGLGGMTCGSFGYAGGTLNCDNCMYEFSECTSGGALGIVTVDYKPSCSIYESPGGCRKTCGPATDSTATATILTDACTISISLKQVGLDDKGWVYANGNLIWSDTRCTCTCSGAGENGDYCASVRYLDIPITFTRYSSAVVTVEAENSCSAGGSSYNKWGEINAYIAVKKLTCIPGYKCDATNDIPTCIPIKPENGILFWDPDRFDFSAIYGQANPSSEILTIMNTGASDLKVSTLVTSGSQWLTILPSLSDTTINPGMLNAKEIDVTPDITGLLPGKYDGNIQITSDDLLNPAVNVPVTLTVKSGVLATTPTKFDFSATQGLPASLSPSSPQTLTIKNTGDVGLTVSASMTLGSPYMTFATITNQVISAGGQITPSVIINNDIGSLAAGTYNWNIRITSDDPNNLVKDVPVTLQVNPEVCTSCSLTTPLSASPANFVDYGDGTKTASLSWTTANCCSPRVCVSDTGNPGVTSVFSAAASATNLPADWIACAATGGTTRTYTFQLRKDGDISKCDGTALGSPVIVTRTCWPWQSLCTSNPATQTIGSNVVYTVSTSGTPKTPVTYSWNGGVTYDATTTFTDTCIATGTLTKTVYSRDSLSPQTTLQKTCSAICGPTGPVCSLSKSSILLSCVQGQTSNLPLEEFIISNTGTGTVSWTATPPAYTTMIYGGTTYTSLFSGSATPSSPSTIGVMPTSAACAQGIGTYYYSTTLGGDCAGKPLLITLNVVGSDNSPNLISATPSKTCLGAGQSFDISSQATDPDPSDSLRLDCSQDLDASSASCPAVLASSGISYSPACTNLAAPSSWTGCVPRSVRCFARDNAGLKSNTLTLTINSNNVGIPTLTSPSGPIQTTTPTFTWSAASYASTYDLQVRDMTLNVDVITQLGITGTSYTPSPSTPLTVHHSYRWWVRANCISCPGQWSSPLDFKVIHVPDPPVTISPSGTICTNSPTYTWNAVSDVTQYDLQVKLKSSATNYIDTSYTPSQAGCASGTGTCSVTPTNLLSPGDWEWQVRATNADGSSAWSVLSFKFSSPGMPVPSAPSGKIYIANPTYIWAAVSGATSYNFWLKDMTTGVVKIPKIPPRNVASISYTPPETLASVHQYEWGAQASDGTCTGPWSTMNFDVLLPPPCAVLISPSGDTCQKDPLPTYTWDAVPTASWYLLHVYDSGGDRIRSWYTAAQAGCASGTGTCSVIPSTELVVGQQYQWEIKTWNDAGDGCTSVPPMSFRIRDCVCGTPTLTAPTETICASRPTYDWGAASGSPSQYRINVEDNLGQDVVGTAVDADWRTISCGSSCSIPQTSYTSAALLDGRYRWWAQAKCGTVAGLWSLPAEFVVNTVPPTVTTSVSPANPTPEDDVQLTGTATASGGRSVSSIGLFVDSVNRNTCSGASCSYTSKFPYKPGCPAYTFRADATDSCSLAGTKSTSFIVNNPPVTPPVHSPGVINRKCYQGSTITIYCDATDANQKDKDLVVHGWVGQCTPNTAADLTLCFNTRSWVYGGVTYSNGALMTPPAADDNSPFSTTITVNQPIGTAIAATCGATDECLVPQDAWGDVYPLCTVVAPKDLTVTLTPKTSSINLGDPVTLTATVGGTATGQIRYYFWKDCQYPGVDRSQCGNEDYEITTTDISVATTFTYTAGSKPKVIVKRDEIWAQDQADVSISGVKDLRVTLTSGDNIGNPPLSIQLTATVSGSAIGPIDYYFWKSCADSSIDLAYLSQSSVCSSPTSSVLASGSTTSSLTPSYLSNAMAKVLVKRDGIWSEARVGIGELRGKTLRDSNGNGQFEAGEVYIHDPGSPAPDCTSGHVDQSGVIIGYNCNNGQGTTVSNRCSVSTGDPVYSLINTKGICRVMVTQPAGWSVTGQNNVVVPITPGQQAVQIFYVSQTAPTCSPTLTCDPPSQPVAIGGTTSYTANYDPDGPNTGCNQISTPVTSSATWSSFNTGIATSNGGGQFRGVSIGSTTVQASYMGLTCNSGITVTPPCSPTLTCSSSQTVPVGDTKSYTATYDQDGSCLSFLPVDRTGLASWSSFNTGIATSTGGGQFRGVSIGLTTVQASYNPGTGLLTCSSGITVTPICSPTLTCDPPSQPVAIGGTTSYTANYDPDGLNTGCDQKSTPVTSLASWSSFNTGIATSTGGGQFRGVSIGSTSAQASYMGLTCSSGITVNPSCSPTLRIDPDSQPVAAGDTVTFKAMYDPDGPNTGCNQIDTDVKSSATWASSDTNIAKSNGGGQFQGVSEGSVTVKAFYNPGTGLLTDDASLSVTPACSPTLVCSPDSQPILVGGTAYYSATYDQDGSCSSFSSGPVTNLAVWSSSNPTIALLGFPGTFSGLKQGSVTVRATYSGLACTAGLDVTICEPKTIVQPPSACIEPNTEMTFTASFSPDNGCTVPFGPGPGTWTWLSNDEFIASSRGGGTFRGITRGDTVIYANYRHTDGNIYGGRADLKVGCIPPVCNNYLLVTPTSASINTGSKQQFTSTYRVGYDSKTSSNCNPGCTCTEQDVTSMMGTTWASLDTSVADKTLTAGEFLGKAGGMTIITADYMGTSDTVTLNVIQPTTLTVNLLAFPGSGLPGFSSTLTAVVGGTSTGPINYYFWKNCASTSNVSATVVAACGVADINYVSSNPQQSTDFTFALDSTPKVLVQRGGLAAEDRTSATISCDLPTFSNIRAVPNPTTNRTISILFTSASFMTSGPFVSVIPGKEAGHTVKFPAALVSKTGNDYIFSYDVPSSSDNGAADIEVAGGCGVDIGSGRGSFNIDTMPPTTSVTCGGKTCSYSHLGAVDVLLSCTDAGGAVPAGCKEVIYKIDAGSWATVPGSSVSLEITGSDTHTLEYYSRDTLDNTEQPKTASFLIYSTSESEMRTRIVISPSEVNFGQPANVEIIGTINRKSDGMELERLTPSAALITEVNITRQKVWYDYLQDQSLTGEQFTAQKWSTTSISWKFGVDSSRYHSDIVACLKQRSSTLKACGSGSYTVNGVPPEKHIDSTIRYPEVEQELIPLTAGGLANFTRGMPIKFLANSKADDGIILSEDCIDDKCILWYDITLAGEIPDYTGQMMQWDPFEKAYKPAGLVSSNDLQCNTQYKLWIRTAVQVGKSLIFGGTIGAHTFDFYVSCVPRLVVNPVEARITRGDRNVQVFTLTFWNPKDEMTGVALDMSSSTAQDLTGKMQLMGENVHSRKSAVFDIGRINKKEYQVYLDLADRSGRYQIDFKATSPTGEEYPAMGKVLIFSEGLPEFQIWQLLALIIISPLIFWKTNFFGKNKKHLQKNNV